MTDATFSAIKYLLKNATVPTACLSKPTASLEDLSQVDILIDHDKIKQVAAEIAPDTGTEIIDLDHGMVWPCFIDMHTHLDKGHIWPRTPNPDGSFDGALTASGQDRETYWKDDDLRTRMSFSIQCAYHHGTQLIRTHLDSSMARSHYRPAPSSQSTGFWTKTTCVNFVNKLPSLTAFWALLLSLIRISITPWIGFSTPRSGIT
jgi:hypothetical protein